MIQNIILAATLLVAFFMCIASFLFGMRVQKSISNGNIPKITLNPVKKVMEAVEQHEAKKEIKKMQEELDDMMGYSRETALKHIKSEVR